MAYRYTLEDLLAILYPSAPTLVDAITVGRKTVEYGLLSVGLKIHCLGRATQFDHIIEELGGRGKILDTNLYRHTLSSMCWVLPPVGSARTAIYLIQAIERATKSKIFKNEEIQIQVCSPGRLRPSHCALLAILFYLGSDILRRYELQKLGTTFSRFQNPSGYERGSRLVLYDAQGDFERDFEWWDAVFNRRSIVPTLPFAFGRTDILTAHSEIDIHNINLVATLLTHVEHHGYWAPQGIRLVNDVRALLREHLLEGVLVAPWVRSDDVIEEGDREFISALEEIMYYALEDIIRVNRLGPYAYKKPEGPIGILGRVSGLLKSYRAELLKESNRLHKGEAT